MQANIHFKSLIQNTQDYATFDKNEAHMVSVINFDLKIGDQAFADLQVEVRQPYGTDFETEPLEVGSVIGYDGPWNHLAFSDLCEAYYRSVIGGSGSGIRIEGSENLRMIGNMFGESTKATMEVQEGGAGW